MGINRGTRRAPERILLYGSYKTGKSGSWLDIARAYHTNNQPGHFYIIDTDFGVPKMIDEGFEWLEDIATIWTPRDFDEMMAASKEIRKAAGPDDWTIIDMLEHPWSEAQNYYINNVYGDEPEDYFIEMRKEVKAKGGKDARSYGGHEGMDWTFITKVYKEFEIPLTTKARSHVFAVTSERKLDPNRGADPDKVKQFKTAGLMEPVGQKGIGHRFDTVMRVTRRSSGMRELTMVGDRGRENRIWANLETNTIPIGDWDEDNSGFFESYMVGIAGWSTENTEPEPERERKKPRRRRRQ